MGSSRLSLSKRTRAAFIMLLRYGNADRGRRVNLSRLRLFKEAILDRNLYGRGFFYNSALYLVFGLFIQFFAHFILAPYMLVVYIPLFCVIVLVSALFTKNYYRREFHPMDSWLAYLMLYASSFSIFFSILAPLAGDILGVLERLFLMGLSELAFVLSLITISVLGQRSSLRMSIDLHSRFFSNQRRNWEKKLAGLANSGKILESLDNCQFTITLFDKGLFGLTILWSCNVMEESVDAIVDSLILRYPDKKAAFRNEENKPLPYPRQLRNLGYKYHSDDENKGKMTIEDLWHKTRNKIAHHNYIPTYRETLAALEILVFFIKEMPDTLHNFSAA